MRFLLPLFAALLLSQSFMQGAQLPPRNSVSGQFNPPAVPLVAVDPYFSIWSQGDKLTDVDTTHWTGKPHRLTSLVRIDGKAYRVMGKEPANVPALEQKSLTVLPTRTIYTFEGSGVELTLTFMTAALPDNLDVLSRPVTYVVWEVRSSNKQTHKIQIYFDASAEITVNQGTEEVEGSPNLKGDVGNARPVAQELRFQTIGSMSQPILAKKGD